MSSKVVTHLCAKVYSIAFAKTYWLRILQENPSESVGHIVIMAMLSYLLILVVNKAVFQGLLELK